MRQLPAPIIFIALMACAQATQVSTSAPGPQGATRADAPLNDADRARQVLSRFTFGARPGDLAAVERIGVKAWVERQLHPDGIPDPVADSVLGLLDIAHKSSFDLTADYPAASDYGVADLQSKLFVDLNKKRIQAMNEIAPAVLIRATVSDRQLLEVMTGFWENHFSISIDKVPSPFWMVDYDRAVRAHALGKFRDLLGAVATSPAMLFYLDNYVSYVDSLHPTPIEWRVEQRRAAHPPLGDTSLVRNVRRRKTGTNENYARELMELHTLGVDGGYSQHDVQEVARCLTGWGFENYALGGSFNFQSGLHDGGEKVVLGVRIPGGRGIEDGQQVLDILARHPSTAHFIARKLVTRFVSDSPPPALVERTAQTYLRTDGDIREMLRTIIGSPEFNSAATYRAKVKTPFELMASLLRVMNATPDTTLTSAQLVAVLGQKIFGRVTPDGWPDQGAAWMNTGSALKRMNLGAKVAANQMPHVTVAAWKPAQGLMALTHEQQVDAVVDALLSGDVSVETRRALLAIQSPPGTLQHVGELVAMAIASSDFQRR